MLFIAYQNDTLHEPIFFLY